MRFVLGSCKLANQESQGQFRGYFFSRACACMRAINAQPWSSSRRSLITGGRLSLVGNVLARRLPHPLRRYEAEQSHRDNPLPSERLPARMAKFSTFGSMRTAVPRAIGA